MTFAKKVPRLLPFLVFLLVGCSRHITTPVEMAEVADLIVLAEVSGDGPQERLIAVEVLKGRLGEGIGFRVGEVITPTLGSVRSVAGVERKVLLFYQKRFGAESWLMTATAAGKNAALVEELRKKRANQSLEPTRAAVTIPADAGLAPAARVAHL